MRFIIVIAFALFTSLGFAQDTGMIVGKILDKDFDNTPLVFANITLKHSNLKSTSDVSGVFLFEQLPDGKHTLVCNYPGYESKEIEVDITSGQAIEVEVSLHTIKLDLSSISSTSTTEK
ncbi:hypothetical protein MHTCC0001_16120 [Flavobacteriaceae bacterium MHTCC 0001]